MVVTTSGRCYVGQASPNHKDAYDRRRGYTIAVGRALRQCAGGHPAFLDEQGRTGRALRDFCAAQLELPVKREAL